MSIAESQALLDRAKYDQQKALQSADLRAYIDCANRIASLESGIKIAKEAYVILFPAE